MFFLPLRVILNDDPEFNSAVDIGRCTLQSSIVPGAAQSVRRSVKDRTRAAGLGEWSAYIGIARFVLD
jgi:hypothetical protein